MGRRDEGLPFPKVRPKDPDLSDDIVDPNSSNDTTYTPYTLIPHPDVDGKYTLVSGDGETLGGTYNADGTAFKNQKAPWDDSSNGNVAPYNPLDNPAPSTGGTDEGIDEGDGGGSGPGVPDPSSDDFNLASWYARILKGDTYAADLQTKKDYAFANFDPNRGELAGTNFEGWATDELLGLPFVAQVRENKIGFSTKLKSSFEVDYDYGYDNQNLYMKLPETGGNNSMIQGFSDEERAQYQDLMDRGRFIDSSDGNAGPGEYTMIWIEDPPEASAWSQFLNNPLVNIMAAIIPGGAQVIATLKAVSGETMHASDWFSFAGGYDVVGQEFGEFAANMGEAASAAVGGSEFLAKAVTAGTKNAIAAIITDQDPLDAFLTGGAQVAVGRILGEVNKLTGGALDSLEEIGTFTEESTVTNADGTTRVVQSQSVGKIARDMIQEAVASQLATGDINEARMAQIVSSAVITTDVLKGFVGERLPSGGIQMIATSLQSSLNAAILGGDVSDAFLNSLAAQLERSVRQSLNNGTFGEDFAEFWDRASGKYDTLYEQAAIADEAAAARAEAAEEVNAVNQLINEGAEKLTALSKTVSDAWDAMDGGYGAGATIEEMNAYEAAEAEYQDYEAEFTDTLNNNYIPRIDAGTETYNNATDTYNTAADLYQSTYDNLSDGGDEYDSGFADALANINEATVNNLSPDFDPEFYAIANGLDPENTDAAYQHYLSRGLPNNAPVNQDAYYKTVQWKALNAGLTVANINFTNLSPAQLKFLNKKFVDQFGNFTDGLTAADIDPASVADMVIDTLSAIVVPELGASRTITEELNAQLEAAGLPTQEIGSTIDDATEVALISYAVGQQESQYPENPYINGAKIVPNPNTGLVEWDDYSVSTNWSVEDGQLVQKVYQGDGGSYIMYDSSGNQIGDLVIVVAGGNDTLEWLKQNDPEGYVNALARMTTLTAEQEGVDSWWYEQAKAALERREEDDGEGILFLSNLFVGTASVLQDIQSVVAALGIDPTSTPFYSGLDKILKLAESKVPEETRANTEAMYKLMSEGEEGVSGAAKAIFGAATEYPSEFLTQVIGLEGIQELVPLLVTMVTTGGVGTAGRFAGLADKAAKVMAQRAGLGAGLTTDIAEAFGGTFNGAYEEAFAVALESGMTEEAADRWAIDAAMTSATAAGTFALISAGVGGQALERLYVKGGANGRLSELFGEIGRRIENGATVFVKEGVSEGIEEGATAVVLESLLYQLDPTRDVSGNIAMNAFMGAIIGGPIAGGTALFQSTGNPIADFMREYNPEVAYLMGQDDVTAQELEDGLEDIGISGVVQTDLLNEKYDEIYTSSTEATNALDQLGVTYTPEDVSNLTGSTPNAGLDAEIATYMATTYGTPNDTDGDGIPNTRDNDPNNPDISNIEYDISTGESTYINEDGNIVVIGLDGISEVFDQDGNPLNTTDDPDPDTSTTYEAGTYIDPDGDGIYQLVGEDGETLGDPLYNEDGTTYTDPDPDPDTSTTYTPGTYVDTDGDGIFELVGEDGETTSGEYNEDGTTYTDPDGDGDGDTTTINNVSNTFITNVTNTIDPEEVAVAVAEEIARQLDGGTDLATAISNVVQAAVDNGVAGIENIIGTPADGDTEATGLYADLAALGKSDQEILAAIGIPADGDTEATGLYATMAANKAALEGKIDAAKEEVLGVIGTPADGDTEATGLYADLAALGLSDANILAIIGTPADGDTEATGLYKQIENLQINNAADLDALGNSLLGVIGTPADGDTEATGLYADLAALGLDNESILAVIGNPADGDTEATGIFADISSIGKDVTDISDRLGIPDDPDTEENEATGVYKELQDLLVAGNSLANALAIIAGSLDTTKTELLDRLGTTETNLANAIGDIGADVVDISDRLGTPAVEDDPDTEEDESADPTGVYKELQDLIDSGSSLADALATVASNLDTTKADLLSQLGTTETNLANAIGEVSDRLGTRAVEDDPNTEEDESADPTGVYKELQDLIDSGSSLAAALDTVATNLDTTKEDILTALGTTEENLASDIASVSAEIKNTRGDILDEVAKNEAAGQDRDTALANAIDTVATNLDTTREDILEQLGTTEENLANDIADVDADLQVVADYVGKPARDVTQEDIDIFTDIIAEQEALADPTSFVPTDQQLQYDVNNDGVIDINDQNMLEQSLAGQDVDLYGDMFNATGLYKYNADIAAQQKLEAEQQFEQEQELEQQRQLEIQTQIDTNQRRADFDKEIRDVARLQAAQPTIATTQQMGLANIGPAYNFESIFRDQKQDQFYNTPFGGYGPNLFGEPAPVARAQGGKIESDTDKLIRLIGE